MEPVSMIIGNPLTFAIESEVSVYYERLSFMALGFFVLHINGKCYGVRASDATMLACSIGNVERRISNRGKHLVGPLACRDAFEIAEAYRCEFYGETQREVYCDMSAEEFDSYFDYQKAAVQWAPDGDEAFDDGGYVLHFDVNDQVRLIAFKSGDFSKEGPDNLVEANSVREAWLPADVFYGILQEWLTAFYAEWNASDKRVT